MTSTPPTPPRPHLEKVPGSLSLDRNRPVSLPPPLPSSGSLSSTSAKFPLRGDTTGLKRERAHMLQRKEVVSPAGQWISSVFITSQEDDEDGESEGRNVGGDCLKAAVGRASLHSVMWTRADMTAVGELVLVLGLLVSAHCELRTRDHGVEEEEGELGARGAGGGGGGGGGAFPARTGHQLHGLLLFAGVVHGERSDEEDGGGRRRTGPMFRSEIRERMDEAAAAGGGGGADAERLQLFFYGERERSYTAHRRHLLEVLSPPPPPNDSRMWI
ncbi:hypothetical protein D5F01_LYC21602 [Larimichthys crocea]|uniref:Uncharacterized protein n=1 Tax=Larimichthys crocea TaxID=215358 RepID=A0A6G0HP92_LARCR|nr:hypothetical protein D5F01_LYC21602 [Larimichthys crocea]